MKNIKERILEEIIEGMADYKFQTDLQIDNTARHKVQAEWNNYQKPYLYDLISKSIDQLEKEVIEAIPKMSEIKKDGLKKLKDFDENAEKNYQKALDIQYRHTIDNLKNLFGRE